MPDILTSRGRHFYFDSPCVGRGDIEEIAHALSHLCRFTGHCSVFYSVAQHSVLVSHLVPPHLALAGLLHDAAEAYVGDMAQPLKMLVPQYKEIERRVELAIAQAFDIDLGHPEVKRADREALDIEMYWLLPRQPVQHPEPRLLMPASPRTARELFLARYKDLTT